MGRYSNHPIAPPPSGHALAASSGTGRDIVRPAVRRLQDKVSEADQAVLVAAYTSRAATIAVLAERYGISDYSVRMILRRADIPPKRRTITPEQTARVLELWGSGESIVRIAEHVGMGHANVRLIVAGRARATR